jgi:DNA mismatch repair ATPase MutS
MSFRCTASSLFRRQPTTTTTTAWRGTCHRYRYSIGPVPSARSQVTTKPARTPLNGVLLQGAVPKPVTADIPVPAAAYPTVVQQSLNNMRKFSHCVLLTRVGNFYELYFHQAEEYAPLLALKLATKKTSAGPVFMAGFPYFQLDRFLKILVQDMKKHVAISEEFANDPSARVKSGGLLFDRKVTRVITPGTLIDEKFVDPWENNFLLSIHANPASLDEALDETNLKKARSKPNSTSINCGLAWIDLSSGDFFTQTSTLESLSSALARISPREIILDQAIANLQSSAIPEILSQGNYIVSHHAGSNLDSLDTMLSMLEHSGTTANLNTFSGLELGAGTLLLQYINIQLQGAVPKLRPPIQQHAEEYMMIDRNSLKALEVRSTLRDGALEGSLLHAVRKTVTKSGNRLLSQRLSKIISISRRTETLLTFKKPLHPLRSQKSIIALIWSPSCSKSRFFVKTSSSFFA